MHDNLPKSIFDITPELCKLVVSSVNNQHKDSSSALIKNSTNLDNRHVCSSCLVSDFEDLNLQKLHFQSDYHLFNLRRRLNKLIPLSLEDYEDLIEECSISSTEQQDGLLDTFEQTLTTSVENEIFKEEEVERKPNSTFETFLLKLTEKEYELKIYKQILTTKDLQIEIDQIKKQTWFIMLLSGGRFSGAIYDNSTRKMIFHKNIQRYTTRRKQGGAQSANDMSKGTANSAGSALRRYNEQALQKDINHLLREWKETIDKCQLLIIRIGSTYVKREFYKTNENILDVKNDQRIRNIPFSTMKPSLKEIQRIYEEFGRAYWNEHKNKDPSKEAKKEKNPNTTTIVAVNPIKEKQTKSKVKESKNKPKKTDANNERLLREKEEIKQNNIQKMNKDSKLSAQTMDNIDTLVDAVKANKKVDEISRIIESDEYLKTNAKNMRIEALPYQPNLLHLATQFNSLEVMQYLLDEIRIDPCDTILLNSIHKTPYELAKNDETRNWLINYRIKNQAKYDWDKSNIPGAPLVPKESITTSRKNSNQFGNNQFASMLQGNKNFSVGFGVLGTTNKTTANNLSDREKRILAFENRWKKKQ